MGKRFLSVLMTVAMFVMMMPQNLLTVSAEPLHKSTQLSAQPVQGSAQLKDSPKTSTDKPMPTGTGDGGECLTGELWQTYAAAEGTSREVTRLEWLAALVDAFHMTVEEDNYPDNYYSDLASDSAIYRTVMVATEFGLVDVEAGEALRPDDAATREFVAHSFNLCMGYAPDESGKYSFSESNSVTYPDDIQVAVDKKWFALSDGAFLPDKAVTNEETEKLLNIAKTALEEVAINPEYESHWQFAEGVIVLPDTVNAQMTGMDELTLTNCDVALKQGDKFGIVSDGIPVVREVVSVTAADTQTIVKTTDVDFADGFKELDVQGDTSINLMEIQAYDSSVEMRYIVGGTEEEGWEDGQIFYSVDELRQNNITDIDVLSVTRIMSVPEYSDSTDFAIGESGSVSITYKFTNISVKHKLTTTEAYFNVAADITIETSAKIQLEESLDLSLVKIPIAAVGFFDVSITGELAGSISLTKEYKINAGVYFSSGDGFRMTREFTAVDFSICAQAEFKIGVRVSGGVDVGALKGLIYVEAGGKGAAKVTMYADGETPKSCAHFSAYLYVDIGCEVKANLLVAERTWKVNYEIYNEKNSPIKVAFHYEDGKPVSRCTRESGSDDSDSKVNCNTSGDSWKYYTPITSRYGYNGASSGLDSDGKDYAVFTYNLNADNEAILTGYKGNVSAVRIPETLDGHTVTKIEESAFSGNTRLRTVVIPDSVTSIGYSAFADCANLSQVTLSKGLQSMGSAVFRNCDALKEIEIPKSLEIAGTEFRDCDSLKTVRFETGTTRVVNNLFSGCNGLEEITIPDTVTSIGDNAFGSCINLKKVNLSDATTKIGENAFYGCTELSEIVLPDSVTSIGVQAFWQCTGLKTMVLPDSVTSIGHDAFTDCTNLSQVTLSKGLQSMGSSVFRNCDALKEIEIPKSLEIGGWAFQDCDSLKTVRFETGTTRVIDSLFSGCNGLEEIIIPDTVTSIGDNAFGSCINLKKVNLSDATTKIGENAFYGCTELSEIVLPDSVTSIGVQAFWQCTGLKTMVLPDSVTSIGHDAFTDCTNLSQVTLSKGLQSMGSSVFRNCDALKEIEIPKSLKIGVRAFQGCDSLKTVRFETGTTRVIDSLFSGCNGPEEIIIPDTVTSIGDFAFYQCKALTGIVLPDSVTSIGQSAFSECDALKDVRLGTGLTAIPAYAFSQCGSLEELVLPYGISKVDHHAFFDCAGLTKLTIPRATTEIGSNAVSYPAQMMIYGIKGTYAETWAAEVGAAFENREIAAAAISLDRTEYTINKGASATLILSVTPHNFTDAVDWKSTDPEIVMVDNAGKITAKAIGTATVKVTVGNQSASCKVTVVQPVTGISLDKTTLNLNALESCQLKATVSPSSAFNGSVIWSSSDESIASVSEIGLVSALRKGVVTVTATAADGSGVSGNCTVTVQNNAYSVERVEDFESPHPYENDCTDRWMYTLADASGLDVTFSSDTFMEEGFDFLYIMDGNGQQVGKYTGSQLAGQTITVPGNTVVVKMESNKDGNAYGFRVTSVVAKGQNPGGDDDRDPGTGDGDDTGLVVTLAEPDQEYVYTGSAIKPAILVKYNGKPLTEGVGYTVKYSNNVKAGDKDAKKAPRITITGKGNLTGSASATFTIKRKSLAEEDVVKGSVVVAKGSRAVPVLVYNGMKLGAKDYEFVDKRDAGKKFTDDGEIVIKGKGNYADDSIKLSVKTVDKAGLKKFTVEAGKEVLTYNPLDNKPQVPAITVKDKESGELLDTTDYVIVYHGDRMSAGTQKFTVVGLGRYSGTVAKTYKIKPLAVTNSSDFEIEGVEKSYPFVSTGVTVGDKLKVFYKGTPLQAGRDYKVTYSNNKKVSGNTDAKYRIAFLGNYKGSRALSGTFRITPAPLSNETVDICISADKIYRKPGQYKSAPYVTVDGVLLKSSNYRVEYYLDKEMRTTPVNSQNKVTMDPETDSVTVYVKITGKGNYASADDKTFVSTSFKVWNANGRKDLSKARVTFYDMERYDKDGNAANAKKVTKLEYTGKKTEPGDVVVEIREGRDWKVVPSDWYDVTYVNNANKGKATAVINAKGSEYAGGRTATFSIVAENLKNKTNLLSKLFGVLGK